MQETTSRVEGGRLYQPEHPGALIRVGTSTWYDWLEQHTAFTFVDHTFGFFLAQKRGTAPGLQEWEASRVRAGKLYRVLLGPSPSLTLSRLQSVARTLAGPHLPGESADVFPVEHSASPPLPPETTVPVSPQSSLIRTRLSPPRSGIDVISRPRLIQRLYAALGGNATLVCAPAGFGKTTLLVEWARVLDRKIAWLSLHETDNELRVFVHSLTAALQNIVPDACQATASILNAQQFPSPERVGRLLSNDLADLPEDVALVLDDYHLIHNSEVHRLLELLIWHLPPQVHLVLATRSDPPLPLGKWQAQGHLLELRGADLRFTSAETLAFLTHILGEELAQLTAPTLEERTGGWIAVLRLAALSLRNTPDRGAFLERLGHSPDRTISGYLVEEILSQLPAAFQEVLMRASMLDTFCAELCAEVLGSATATEQVQATLDSLERSNLFLVPLDERHGWYRLHPLFQGLLRQRWREHASAEELATLHRRASAWYATQGLVDEALGHAFAAGDVSGAARLIEAQLLRVFEQEQWMWMERWLRLLPEKQVESSPGLLFARVWTLHAHGQLTDFPRLLSEASQLLASRDSSMPDQDDPQYRLQRALIAIAWSRFQYQAGQAQASLQSARSALEWTPPGEAYVASMALFLLAMASQLTGQKEVALAALQQGQRELPARPAITARLLFAQALVYQAAGKLPQVEQTARHLLHIAQDADLALSQAWAHWFLGMVYYEWNNLDEVIYHFSAVIANQHTAHFWTVQDAMCVLALAYQAQGLSTHAQETAQALLDWVQDQHNLSQLLTAYAFCGYLALLQGEVKKAEHWLELAGEQAVAGPMMFFEDPPVTRAWMLLAKGDEVSVAQGQELLTRLLQHVEAIHNSRKTIQVLALQAWAHDLQGQETQALDVLERALVLARPDGFTRTFADVPRIARLLQELLKRRKTQQGGDRTLDAYLQHILVAMRPVPVQADSTEGLMQQEGLEPLTERELHILRLLDKDHTNKEIARELVITPGTVKVHINNLYRKLNVNNRRAAVTLAKALRLLPPDKVSN